MEPVEVDRGKIAILGLGDDGPTDEVLACGEGVVGLDVCFMAERRWSVLEFVDVTGLSVAIFDDWVEVSVIVQ